MTASGKFYLPEYDAVKFTKKQVLLAFPIECFRAITVGCVAMAFAHAVKRWYISVPVSFVYAILSLNAPEAVYFAVAFFAELFGGSADIIERMPMNMKYYDMVGTQYLGDANIGAIIITFICVIVFSVGIAYFILWLNKKFKNRLKKSED